MHFASSIKHLMIAKQGHLDKKQKIYLILASSIKHLMIAKQGHLDKKQKNI